ncbi:MAG: glycosyltransferase family 2 protein [Halodesulfovibrio sp.]|uniref:glycosyltransferase family 2 protein n=1 Tax=Halodesulfovibrio sp. TaxID=1912772 RepID=UPI00359ED3FF
MKILLSIVVPTYNSRDYLIPALTSLVNQTYQLLEIIVVNDGSTDDSLEIIERFAEADARIIILNQENKGYGAACNLGMQHAKGDYLAIFEPDDILDLAFYSMLIKAASKTQADIIKCHAFYYKCEENLSISFSLKDACDKLAFRDEVVGLWKTHPAIWNGIYKRSFLEKNNVIFPETAGASFQDMQFIVSLYYSEPTIYLANYVGYYYRVHPGQSVANADQKVPLVIENWRIQYDWIRLKECPNYDFFVFSCFNQFYSLFSTRVQDKMNKQMLLSEMIRIKKLTGVSRLCYSEAHRDLKLLFWAMAFFPILNPIIGSIAKLNNAFKNILQFLRRLL